MGVAARDAGIIAWKNGEDRPARETDIFPVVEVVEDSDCGADAGQGNGTEVAGNFAARAGRDQPGGMVIQHHAELPAIRYDEIARFKDQGSRSSATPGWRGDDDGAVAVGARRDDDGVPDGNCVNALKAEELAGAGGRGIDRIEHLDRHHHAGMVRQKRARTHCPNGGRKYRQAEGEEEQERTHHAPGLLLQADPSSLLNRETHAGIGRTTILVGRIVHEQLDFRAVGRRIR